MFFTSSMQFIKDPAHKSSIITSAQRLPKEEYNEIKFHLKVLSGPLTLIDVAAIVDAFLNSTLPVKMVIIVWMSNWTSNSFYLLECQ